MNCYSLPHLGKVVLAKNICRLNYYSHIIFLFLFYLLISLYFPCICLALNFYLFEINYLFWFQSKSSQTKLKIPLKMRKTTRKMKKMRRKVSSICKNSWSYTCFWIWKFHFVLQKSLKLSKEILNLRISLKGRTILFILCIVVYMFVDICLYVLLYVSHIQFTWK